MSFTDALPGRPDLDRQPDPENFARFLANVVAPAYHLDDVPSEPDPEPETMGQGLDGIVASAGAARPPSSVGHEFHGAASYATGRPPTTLYHSHAGSPAPAVGGEPQPFTPVGDPSRKVVYQAVGAPVPAAAMTDKAGKS